MTVPEAIAIRQRQVCGAVVSKSDFDQAYALVVAGVEINKFKCKGCQVCGMDCPIAADCERVA